VSLANLRRRIYLTYKYRGLGTVIRRAVTFPLRFTPLKPYLELERTARIDRSLALQWYRRHGRQVTVVIPSYRDAEHVTKLVAGIRRTTRSAFGLLGPRDPVRIVVSDDASGPEHLAALQRIKGIQIVEGRENAGFAANVNRGIVTADPVHDIVVLNSDVLPRRGWLACLQYDACRGERVGIVGGKLLYRDQRIQFAGTVRNHDAPEWFDHRYRFKASRYGPANTPGPVLAVTGACMYVKRAVIERIGLLDEAYPMAYEDVDFCLRAWQAGFRVLYCPEAELYHLESVTRGTHVGERERASQTIFWERWRNFFDARDVRTVDGKLRVVYVTEGTGIGGGHRDVFEHLNGLVDRGHEAELWSLDGAPKWFELRAPVRKFQTYDELSEALAPVAAIKIATWWATAAPVWEASVTHGIPVYFVQDIETSYYPDSETKQSEVLASYRPEFRYMTISSWNRDRLRETGVDASLIPPGIALDNFCPLDGVRRRADMVLAIGRSQPLKNLPLTIAAWRALPEPRPELCLFGIEPELADGYGHGIRYVESPSDEEVTRLLNEATVFVQTSTHEGFCLPALEAMATGCTVVCTDAHGNRDFCEDAANCLMAAHEIRSVTKALARALGDSGLRERLGRAGIDTAVAYSWPKRIDELERFLDQVATPGGVASTSREVPDAPPTPTR
jgi:GT2 family glycosyltransferase/glycosyltransferase involved in cell wall biosynthesis